jgi:methionine synthase II (cobalamin-independent)
MMRPGSRSTTWSALAFDIITDGEIRRESYSNRFTTALSGVDLDNPATVRGRTSGKGTWAIVIRRSSFPVSTSHSRIVRH